MQEQTGERARRIRVVGVSGAGKTTFARELARRSGRAHLELDAVFWDAGWTYRDLDAAHALVADFVRAHPEWVIDGNWSSRLEGRLEPGTDGGADLIVWLDYARPVVMRRLVRRTLRRAVLRENLWHGNRERPSTWFARDPHENILLWGWTQHPRIRERYAQRVQSGEPIVRLGSPHDAAAWLAREYPEERPDVPLRA